MKRSKQVLKLLKEGKKVTEIATITGTTISNIQAHKHRLIKKGLWKSNDTGLQWSLDLDQTTELLIDRLQKANSVPKLIERINLLEKEKQHLENDIISLRKFMDDKMDKERRYRLAVESGEVNPPLSNLDSHFSMYSKNLSA